MSESVEILVKDIENNFRVKPQRFTLKIISQIITM